MLTHALAHALALPADTTGTTWDARAGQVKVPTPRLEESVTIDGDLSEPAWGKAAVLTGFSQYSPVD